jgi:hypothetical protein
MNCCCFFRKSVMKKIAFLLLLALSIVACSKEKKDVERKWRVLDEQRYAPSIDEETVLTDLDELEKLIFAPSFFVREKGGFHSFEQTMKYTVESVVGEETRNLMLEESAEYFSDVEGSFKMSYKNSSNEGWSMVWKDNFLYRRQFGGEYTKSVSMGEHRYLRESIFGSIPAVYKILRNHAVISSHGNKQVKGTNLTAVNIVLKDKSVKRKGLSERTYLQNLQGTEEMKDDALAAEFLKKDKKEISGEMTVYVDGTLSVVQLEFDVSFKTEDIKFSIEAKRTLSAKPAEKIEVPEYTDEYHRRSLDS